MEFRAIELTKCCHHLYQQLKTQTTEELVGEPWFRFVGDEIYFSSRTASNKYADLLLFERERFPERKYVPKIQIESFKPISNIMTTIIINSPRLDPSGTQEENLVINLLTDFFRLHYKKFD
jgi:hypothetical protein